MLITLPRAALFAALGQVKAVVERRNTIPILSNVRLDADRTGLTLTATDLDIEAKARIDGAPETIGATTVHAAMLFDIVRKMPDKEAIALVLDEAGTTLVVKAGRSRFVLPALPAADFPDISAGAFDHRFALPAATLKRLIDKTEFAISHEETRYYLNGVYLHPAEGDDGPVLRAVATDGHRLARAETLLPEGAAGMAGIIVPAKAVARLRVIAEGHEGDVTIETSATKIRATAGGVVLTSKLIDGTFPDYERVIPRGNGNRLTVDRAVIGAAIDRVSTLASGKGRAVKLDIEAGRVTMRVVNADAGSAEETIDAELAGTPLEIGFNSAYFGEILSVLGSERVVIALGNAGAPILITNPLDASTETVLMPMRV